MSVYIAVMAHLACILFLQYVFCILFCSFLDLCWCYFRCKRPVRLFFGRLDRQQAGTYG